MDYAFVPGLASRDGYLLAINSALALHPNLSLLSPTPDTLSDFFSAAKTATASVSSEDLIVGTHADDEGIILFPLDATIPPPVTYEKLQNAGSIKLPPELNKPGTSFRIFGCAIGSDRCKPLLQMLKQALGNPQAVVAPKYLYGASPFSGGFLETMLYEFRILSPKALGSRDAVKQAFQAGSNASPPRFVDVNGTKISPDLWDTWLPSESMLNLKPATAHLIPFTVKASVSINAAANVSVTVNANIRAYWAAIHETVTIPHVDTGQNENSTKSRKEMAQAGIPNDPRFKSHPYPFHTRYHYDSIQSFIDGVNWLVVAAEGGTMWQLTFDRYLYELLIPVTEPADNSLIFNYYQAGTPPVLGMFSGHSVDARLFTSV